MAAVWSSAGACRAGCGGGRRGDASHLVQVRNGRYPVQVEISGSRKRWFGGTVAVGLHRSAGAGFADGEGGRHRDLHGPDPGAFFFSPLEHAGGTEYGAELGRGWSCDSALLVGLNQVYVAMLQVVSGRRMDLYSGGDWWVGGFSGVIVYTGALWQEFSRRQSEASREREALLNSQLTFILSRVFF